jgi:hypothetical protein
MRARMWSSVDEAKEALDLRIAQLNELVAGGYVSPARSVSLATRYKKQLYDFTRPSRAKT